MPCVNRSDLVLVLASGTAGTGVSLSDKAGAQTLVPPAIENRALTQAQR